MNLLGYQLIMEISRLVTEINQPTPEVNQLLRVCQQSYLMETEYFALCLTELK